MKSERVLIALIVVIFLIVFGLKELFTIHNIQIFKEPDYLFPDGKSTLTLEVEPVNRFGTKVPFREIKSDFEVVEGIEKVKIIEKRNNKIVFRSNYETGRVVVRIKNIYILIPIEVTIEIKGQFT